jgi:two-component system chemotaxis response regulator CheY
MTSAETHTQGDDQRPILVVDDSTAIREALRDLLIDEGYSVAEAAHGRAALARLATAPKPCLVILDLIMPVMNGAEFLSAVRADADAAKIPIVLLSAVSGVSWIPIRPDRSLRKPIDFDLLLRTIVELCH